MKKIWIWILAISLIASVGFLFFVINLRDKQIKELNADTRAQDLKMAEMLREAMGKAEGMRYSNDSLSSITRENISYRELVRLMVGRDLGATELPKVGMPVTFKTDSMRGIVRHVVMGGGKYDYYIKCRVTKNNGETVDVRPDMLLFEKKD